MKNDKINAFLYQQTHISRGQEFFLGTKYITVHQHFEKAFSLLIKSYSFHLYHSVMLQSATQSNCVFAF